MSREASAAGNTGGEIRLIKRVQRGERAAFKELYALYAPRIYALALRMSADREAAADLTQEIFMRTWEKIGSFAFKSGFYTWLHRLAVNLILRKGHKLKEVAGREQELEAEQGYEAAEDRGQERLESRVDCERALHKLPDQPRKVFVLYAMEGYSHREIGQLMGISEGASKAHLSRARTLLKRELKL